MVGFTKPRYAIGWTDRNVPLMSSGTSVPTKPTALSTALSTPGAPFGVMGRCLAGQHCGTPKRLLVGDGHSSCGMRHSSVHLESKEKTKNQGAENSAGDIRHMQG